MNSFVFEPVYQDYLWGGDRIGKRYHRREIPIRCAESWEIADRPEGMSRLKGGRILRELVKELGPRLLGQGRHHAAFPLLVKIIDARETLSVQVHPNEETALRCGGEPKTETWVVLEGGPVYVGFKTPSSPEELQEAFHHNRVEELLQKIEVKAGDVVFLPGGRIHAIGAGCMMLEVQQNSNTTYRVYDWGRPRPIHLPQALQCIQWNDCANPIRKQTLLEQGSFFKRWNLITSRFFSIEKLETTRTWQQEADPNSFQMFFHLERGESLLLPAEARPLELVPGSYLRIFI